ncbi:FadR/GntR family transcriptional regulator [Natribacillus halophilus]|uniref:Transcriptional regulator, GntR family n=1 Tax=Natribacillus halophilus TaxID=549003 RepID=A0A1G8LWL7_9BACI|nr:FadR/GntR family transcriptional regulator [Natribacillus halophilus]SDI60079.1 transcriptional regulator, GntR family [Natribacillus halophilus]
MNIQKIPTRKISEQVAEQLEQSIMNGRLSAGEKLQSVRELTEQFEVGRSAVRDAIAVLKGKGMVKVVQGEGTYVCDSRHWETFGAFPLTDAKSIQDLYMVRKMMEIGIAEQAALKREQEQLAEMEDAMLAFEKGREADYQFHMALARATDNDILVQLMESVSKNMKDALMDCHRMIAADMEAAVAIQNQHRAIYETVKNQHVDGASAAMKEHLQFVEELLQRGDIRAQSDTW